MFWMKNINWLLWIGVILVFILLTFFIGKLTMYIKDSIYMKNLSVEVSSEAKEDGDIVLEKEEKDAKYFHSTITIPYLDNKEIDDEVYEWAREEEDAFQSQLKEEEDRFFFFKKGEFTVDSDIYKLTDDIQQLKIHSNQSFKKQENDAYETIAYNVAEDEIVPLQNIIENQDKKRELLQSLLLEQAEGKVNEEQLDKFVNDFDQLNWIVDQKNEAFHFYFDQGDISNQAEDITLSLTDIYPLLTGTYKNVLISDDLQAKIEKEQQEKLNESKKIAITFDDGPGEEGTEEILQALDEYNAKATFFMLSQSAEKYPDLAKEVAEKGHEIANHSITHPDLKKVDENQATEEIEDSKETITEITGEEPTLFRPPYGSYTETVTDLTSESNQNIVLWSLDTRDWESLNAKQMYKNVVDNAQPGSIILMHDIHHATADAVPHILEDLSDEGYEFVTVSELTPLIPQDENGVYYGVE